MTLNMNHFTAASASLFALLKSVKSNDTVHGRETTGHYTKNNKRQKLRMLRMQLQVCGIVIKPKKK